MVTHARVGAMHQTDSIRDPIREIFLIIERTKRLDPEAFARRVSSEGVPGPFVEPDESRRSAAYERARTEVREDLTDNNR